MKETIRTLELQGSATRITINSFNVSSDGMFKLKDSVVEWLEANVGYEEEDWYVTDYAYESAGQEYNLVFVFRDPNKAAHFKLVWG